VPPSPVTVVGAGIAGIACARALAAAGVPVRVLDRGRRPGGRMASRTLSQRTVDLGASYLTAHEGSPFAAVVDDWVARGLARPWTDTFAAAGPVAAAVGRALGIDVPPAWTAVHRWTYARPTEPRSEPFGLADGIGVCGDGWSAPSRVESAWTSGTALGRALPAGA
jgi:predicted NAD/FAD-dependent oxidoreductase